MYRVYTINSMCGCFSNTKVTCLWSTAPTVNLHIELTESQEQYSGTYNRSLQLGSENSGHYDKMPYAEYSYVSIKPD